MTHKKETAEKIHPRMFFRNEMFYLSVACASLLIFEWLKNTVKQTFS
jgi:hypothetical protein